MTAIVLVSRRPIYRKALRALLDEASDFTVTRESSGWPPADAFPPSSPQTVCVVDAGTISPTPAIASRPLLPAVFLVSGEETPAFLQQVYERASTGCLLHTDSLEDLYGAIRAAARRTRYTSASFHALMQAQHLPASVRSPRRLSPREWEVLYYIALGYANKEIAHTLVISVKTVEAHRTNLMEKLAMKTRKELVEYAYRAGLIHSGK
ncbi:DNA-binding response regulator [Marinococcus halophilus]|uniref:DNA-binding response regulator n=1 Tax=Marinococcus halophilus TaxID=1371 RepID=A0A510Y5B5_MARHA|nr:response regulator transcription factor [Marinococcus halophilus]OZT80280.1 DNA-binding response regulator [Marinococcus halophilus]GEK58343.1 DNA-binding response regulator [Marinococcus halophilus]